MKARWSFATSQPVLASRLAADLKLSPLLVQCLLNRGLSDPAAIASFLQPRLRQLSDPFLLPNMAAAVNRLFLARARNEHVIIFGDYDVDGITATALLAEVLSELGWNVTCYLPHRLEEGYGLSQEGVENCLGKTKASLLLAVDCGSTAVATIDWMNSRGVDVLVLDHHQISSPAPAAAALVNPQINPAPADFHELCSAGLAFKLAHALIKQGRGAGLPGADSIDLRRHLDLVALGTIADMVPVTGENRIFVSAGLERLNRTERAGLKALTRVAQITGTIGVYEVGFLLAPRLNASGRLENALLSLNLLMSGDDAEAGVLARQLDSHNRERQVIERRITEQAVGAIRARFNPDSDYVIVEGQLLWHIGVVGIVASRVLREFYRPTIIIGGDGQEWRGSGRSIEGFNLAAALGSCSDLLTRHGGHAMAAGLSLRSENIDELRLRLNTIAMQTLPRENLKPSLRIDAEVPLSELTLDRVAELAGLEPLGQRNPAVHLAARGLSHARPPQRIGRDQQHVKMWLANGAGTLEALWWNCQKQALPEGKFDLAFCPQVNEFNNRRTVQLKVLDWQPSHSNLRT
jgi:single-stranded-DNA-specific exonuclease